MAFWTKKTEGGQGGKVGHSNMTHRDLTETIKKATKKARRVQSKKLCKEFTNDNQ
jgi:hypothetical protein